MSSTKAAVIAIVLNVVIGLAVLLAFWLPIAFRLDAIPKMLDRPFSAWSDAWTTPRLSAGEYWISLDYARNEGGRLGTPLKLEVIDMTTNQVLSIAGRWVGGTTFDSDWETEIVGQFNAVEGHRYRITVDQEQLAELARCRHRLRLGLSATDIDNRIGEAIFGQ